MQRQELATSTNLQSIPQPQKKFDGISSLPYESNDPQQMRPKGDPASVQLTLNRVPAGFFERHTLVVEP